MMNNINSEISLMTVSPFVESLAEYIGMPLFVSSNIEDFSIDEEGTSFAITSLAEGASLMTYSVIWEGLFTINKRKRKCDAFLFPFLLGKRMFPIHGDYGVIDGKFDTININWKKLRWRKDGYGEFEAIDEIGCFL